MLKWLKVISTSVLRIWLKVTLLRMQIPQNNFNSAQDQLATVVNNLSNYFTGNLSYSFLALTRGLLFSTFLYVIASPSSYPCQRVGLSVINSFRCDAIASPSFASLFLQQSDFVDFVPFRHFIHIVMSGQFHTLAMFLGSNSPKVAHFEVKSITTFSSSLDNL